MLTTRIMTDDDKREVCSWKYSGEYEIYNMPSYDEMIEKEFAFLNPKRQNNYNAYFDKETCVGFTNILEEDKEIFIGIGVTPNYCGRGYGQAMLKIVIEKCRKLYPNKPLYLEVRSWNKRAITCYQKAGFVIEGDEFVQETSIGIGTFYRMIHQ